MKRDGLLRSQRLRGGYTLIEILIVVGILVVLLTMTLMTVRFTRDGDRVTAAAAQIQSFLAGARDRAIYARAPRGVRLFLDPDNPRALSAMVYIDPSQTWSDGVIQLRRWDPEVDGRTNIGGGNVDINQDGVADDPRNVWMVLGEGTGWWELKRRGLLYDGMRIRIPRGLGGSWYPINTRLIDITKAPPTTQILVLGIPYRDPGNTPVERSQAFESGGPEDYEIELAPRILPGEPAVLPEGTVIDLAGSQLANAALASYVGYIDFVYSSRGGLVGDSATVVNHLYVCDREDSLILWEEFQKANLPQVPSRFVPLDSLDPATVPWVAGLATAGDPYNVKDRRIVTISGQTGGVSIHPVNGTVQDPNSPAGFAADPYFFAETGETAK
jgi:prepilin-type N-terminal cleavage/methylation domain-containing protein